jgi:putative ABC transport system permease protein
MIGFLFKGLLRDRSRSQFPFLVVASGVMLTVFLYSWIAGIEADMIRSSASFLAGHVRITTRAYAREADQAPNDLAYIGVADLLASLRRDYPRMTWTPRIRFGGLLDLPDEQGETRAQSPVAGLAVDLLSPASPEPGILNLKKALLQGRLPDSGEVLIGDELAHRLQVQPGAIATLIGSDVFGGFTTANFRIAGTIRFGVGAMDRGALIADVADIQSALAMPDAAGEILGFFPDFIYDARQADQIAARFNQQYANSTDEFAPEMSTLRSQAGLGEIFDMVTRYMAVIVVIFLLAMSIVLWNAGLMGSLRRYGEIGVRLAIGEKKGHLYRSLLVEAAIIGLVGSLAGTAVGVAIGYWLQVTGINVSGMIKNATMMIPDVYRARITPACFFIGFIPGLAATLIGTAISGIGIYRRQTARLIKELET